MHRILQWRNTACRLGSWVSASPAWQFDTSITPAGIGDVPRPAYRTERNAARDPGDVEGTAGPHRSQQAAAALCVMLKVSAMVQEIAPRQHMVAGSRITQSRLVEPGLQRSIALLKQRRVSPRLAAWGAKRSWTMRSRPTWRTGSAAKDLCRLALAIMGAIGSSAISAAERPKYQCESPEARSPLPPG